MGLAGRVGLRAEVCVTPPASYPLLRDLQPEGARELARLEAAAWSSTDRELLALCSLRVAEMLGGDCAANDGALAIDERKRASLADWDSSALFSAAERAHLAFTEQFVTSVRHVSDADVDALLEHASPEQVRSFVAALYAVEMAQRVDLVARVVLGDGGDVDG
jgi:hypothetical protein